MKIDLVQLEDVRSHLKSTVPFARGFNCLVGGLGCGKSSILYSIDFALFGDPIGRSFDYLLREGSQSARVTVQFSHNGKTYTISRELKRRGKGISQDFDELKLFEEDVLISSLKSEAVAEQVKAITGLDKELFREIVWVRQEHLKEFLDVPPRERQRRLDDLFGLSDYETAWSSLAGYEKEYEGEKRAYEKDSDLVGIDKLGRDYEKAVEEFSVIEVDIQNVSKKVVLGKKGLEEAESRLKALEEVKLENERLKREETEIRVSLMHVRERLESLVEDAETKKGVIDSLENRLRSLEGQAGSDRVKLREIGLGELQLDALGQNIRGFDDRLSSLRGEREAANEGVRLDEKRVSSLVRENLCPLCLQALTDDYKARLVERIREENDRRLARVGQLTVEIDEVQRKRDLGSVALSDLAVLMPRIDDLKVRITEENERLEVLSGDLVSKQEAERDLSGQLVAVRKELEVFDSGRLEVARKVREEAFREFHVLESDLRFKESRRSDLRGRLDDLKDRIDVAQGKIERVRKILKAFDVIGAMRDAYRGIQPKLRSEFVKVLRVFVQRVLDDIVGSEGSELNVVIDDTYTPFVVSEGGLEREVSNLSGGERTLLAFAYRLGLGQLIMQSRTGHGLSLLLLDEPTESLGREDGSIDRLAEAVSRFKAVEQTIAVTHSEVFAEKADHVIRLEKEAGVSKVTVEK